MKNINVMNFFVSSRKMKKNIIALKNFGSAPKSQEKNLVLHLSIN